MYVRVCALWGLGGLLQDMVGLGVPGVPRFRQDRERVVPDRLVLASFAEGASSVGICCSALGARLCLSTGFLAFRSAQAYGGQWVCCLSVLLSSYCLDQCGGGPLRCQLCCLTTG